MLGFVAIISGAGDGAWFTEHDQSSSEETMLKNASSPRCVSCLSLTTTGRVVGFLVQFSFL